MNKLIATATLAITPLAMATEHAMNAALADWQQQVKQYENAMKNAPSDDVRASITPPDGRDIAPRLWQSLNGRTGTRPAPKGKGRIPTFEFEQNWALPGIVWILENQQAFTAAFTEDEQQQLNYFSHAIIDSLHRIHYNNPSAGSIAPSISISSSVKDYELLRKIYEKNQHKGARAAAAMGMSLMLNNPMISSVEGSEAMARAKRLYYLKQSILLGGKDGKFGSQPIAEVALEQAYFLRNLSVGAIAPLLKLQDAQGETHRLPTPGNLTLLLFWSPDSGTSVNLLRDIDKLKSQYPGLEICPIMPHCTAEEQRKTLSGLGLASSFIDNADGTAFSTYRITSLPSVILINKQCRILYGGAPDVKLQTTLEAIKAKEEAAAKASRPTVSIEQNDAPVIQPGFTPKPPAKPDSEEIPALREMPEF